MKKVLTLVVVAILLAAGRDASASDQSDPKRTPPTGCKGRLVVAVKPAITWNIKGDPWRGYAILAVDPETGASERIVENGVYPSVAAVDETIAYLASDGVFARKGDGSTRCFRVRDPERTLPPLISANGQEIIYSAERPEANDGRRTWDSWRCAVARGEPTKLPIPETDGVIDWSPDGQLLLTLRYGRGGGGIQLHAMRPDGTGERRLSDGTGVISIARFSPDGKRVVYMHQDGVKNALWVMDLDGRHRSKIVDYSADWHPWACWSPDGKRLAVMDWKPGSPPMDYHLDIMDPDGRNRRTLPLPKVIWMSAPDWR